MNLREQKVAELMEDFHSLKHSMAFKPLRNTTAPRITPSQWGVLMMIGRHIGSTVKDVASCLGITSSAATQLVDGLVKSGYVLRQPNKKDRRTVQLMLPKKTEVQMEKMKKQFLRKFVGLFEVLDDQEFDLYLKLNKKITNTFKK